MNEATEQTVSQDTEILTEQHYASGETTPTTAVAAPATHLAATNTFALVAIILAFIQPIAAVIFGHIGMSQIKKHGDTGRGLALTALIIGYFSIVMIILFTIAYIGFFVFWGLAIGSSLDSGYGGYGW